MIKQIRLRLKESISITQEKAAYFFKTGKGEYAQNDIFIGVTVPSLRKLAKEEFSDISLDIIQDLLTSKINEERMLALIILVMQYQKAELQIQENLYHFYLNNLDYVNNWNLVDASAHHIVGAYLWDNNGDKSILFTLAKSESLWKRRVSIVSTWYFIKNNYLDCTFKIAELLLNDKHDLIHKAVGWMLREAGKRDQDKLFEMLEKYARMMPRTMLRYAIEKFPNDVRKQYLELK